MKTNFTQNNSKKLVEDITRREKSKQLTTATVL